MPHLESTAAAATLADVLTALRPGDYLLLPAAAARVLASLLSRRSASRPPEHRHGQVHRDDVGLPFPDGIEHLLAIIGEGYPPAAPAFKPGSPIWNINIKMLLHNPNRAC